MEARSIAIKEDLVGDDQFKLFNKQVKHSTVIGSLQQR